MTDDERRLLERRLESARRRLAEATPHGPEWDAAAEAVDELEERALEAGILLGDGRASPTILRPVG